MKVANSHDGALVNFGSQTGRQLVNGAMQLVPIEISSGPTESNEISTNKTFILCCQMIVVALTTTLIIIGTKANENLVLKMIMQKKVSCHKEANPHPGDKVEEKFTILK